MYRLSKIKWVSVAIVFFFVAGLVTPPTGFAADENWIFGGQQIGPQPNPSPPPKNPQNGDPNRPSCTPAGGKPVSIYNGEENFSCVDMTIPGRGMNVEIKHTYRSGIELNSQFGYGWMMSYYHRIRVLPDGSAHVADGETYSFKTFEFQGGEYIPPAGTFESLVRNPNGTWDRTKPDGTTYNYDTDGKLVTIRDRNDNTITLSYDPQGLLPINGGSEFGVYGSGPGINPQVVVAMDYRLTKITDTVGRDIDFFYYPNNGRLEKIVDYSGREVSFTYDPATRDLLTITKPATVQYPTGVTKTFTYLPQHRLETYVDEKGQQVAKNYYDTEGRIFQQDHGTGTWQFQINGNNTETVVTDREGNVVQYNFNARGQMTRKREFTRGYHPNEPQYYETTYTYDSQENLATITFPRGNGIKYTYDENNSDPRARGNLLELRRKEDMSQPDGPNDIVTTLTYEPLTQQVKTFTDPRGNTTTFRFDYEFAPAHILHGTKGNLVAIVPPPGEGIRYFLPNQHGQLSLEASPNGYFNQYTYYANTGYLHQIIRDSGGLNATTTVTYDAWGNIDTITDAENHTIDLDYNELGWLVQETNPLTYVTKYTHDANGNVEKVERQANAGASVWQTTDFTYDVLNNLKTITDPLQRLTTINYDNNENISSVIDAENNTTSYSFDERNLIWTVTDANTPAAGVTTYHYDPNGNLAEIVDANTHTTGYDYDLFDRQTMITYDDGNQTELMYDPASNLAQVTRGFNTATPQPVVYGYDNLNRLSSKSYPLNPVLDTIYQYDLGSRLNLIFNPGTQHVAGFFYDNLNNLWVEGQIYGAAQHLVITWYAHDKVGNRRSVLYPSGKLVEYTYDANDRMDLIKVNGNTVVDYDYDLLDRRDTKSYFLAPSPLVTDYTFNIANELDDLDNRISSAANPISRFHYTYDNVSNRRTLTKTLGASVSNYTYNYNTIYELEGVTGSAVESYLYDLVGNRTVAQGTSYTPNTVNQYTAVGSVVPTYDVKGNMTSDGTNTYTYDEDNRLITSITPITAITYEYDGLNRRTMKDVNGTKTYFIYSQDEVIEERRADGTLIADYVLGEGLDETISMTRGGSTYYYLHDGLGSVRELVDGSGNVVEQYDYDAYGNILSPLSSVGNPYYFTGRRLDPETGIYYYRARMYDQRLGRFLQRDSYTWGPDDERVMFNKNNVVDVLSAFTYTTYKSKAVRRNLEKEFLSLVVGDLSLFYKSNPSGVSLGDKAYSDVIQLLGNLNPRYQHRYIYPFNNPTNFTDPEGHYAPWVVWTAGVMVVVWVITEVTRYVDFEYEDPEAPGPAEPPYEKLPPPQRNRFCPVPRR